MLVIRAVIRAVRLIFSPMASRWVAGYFVGAAAGKSSSELQLYLKNSKV